MTKDRSQTSPWVQWSLFLGWTALTIVAGIDIYNVAGQQVKTLVESIKPAGTYAVTWDGTDADGKQVTSGVYFYRILAGQFSQTRKLMLMK